jgi:hypothetical protein
MLQSNQRVTYHAVAITAGSRVTNHTLLLVNPNAWITQHRVVIQQPSRVTLHQIQIGLSSRVTQHEIAIRLPSRVTRHEVAINRNELPPVYIIPRPSVFNINDTVFVIPAIEIYYDNNTQFEILEVRVPFGARFFIASFSGTPLPRSYDNVKLLSLENQSNRIPLRVGRHDVFMKYRYLNQETLLMVEKYVYVPIYVVSNQLKRIDHIFDKQFIRSSTQDRTIRDEYRLTISFCEEGEGVYDAIEYSDENGLPLQVLDVLPSEEFVTQRAFQENTASYPSWTLQLNNRFPKEKVFEREINQQVQPNKLIPQHFYVVTVMNLRTGELVCFGNLQITGENTRFQARLPKVTARYKGIGGSWTTFEHFQGGLTITVAHPASVLRGIPMVDQESKRISYTASGSTGKGFLDYLFTTLRLSILTTVNGVLQPTRLASRRVYHFFELCELFSRYLNENSLLAKFGFLAPKAESAYFAGLDQIGFVRYRESVESVEDWLGGTQQKRVLYQEHIDRLEGAIDVTTFIYSRHYGNPEEETPEGIGRRSYSVEVTRGLRDKEGFFTGESENGAEYPYWWGRYESANDLKRFFEQTLRLICDFEVVQNADGSYSVQALWHSLYHDGKYYRFKRPTTPSFVEAPFKIRRITPDSNVYSVIITPSSNDAGYAMGLRVGQRVKVDGQIMYVSSVMQNTNGLTVRLVQQHEVEPNVPPQPIPQWFTELTLEVEVGFVREFKFERKLVLKSNELSVATNLYSNNGHLLNKADVGYKPESRKAIRVLSKELFGAGNTQRIDGLSDFRDDFQQKILFQTEYFNEVRASYQSRLESITADVQVATRRWEKRFLLEYQPNADRDIYTPRNRILIETSYGYGYPVAFYTNCNGEMVFHKFFAEAYQAHVIAMNVVVGRSVLDSPAIISLPNKETINSTWIVETDLLSLNGETERLFFVDGVIDRIRGFISGNMIKMPPNFLPAPIVTQVPMILKATLANTQDNTLRNVRRDGFMLGRSGSVFGGNPKFLSLAYSASGIVPIFDVQNRNFKYVSIYQVRNGKKEYLKSHRYDCGIYGTEVGFNELFKDIEIPSLFSYFQPFDAYSRLRDALLLHENPTGRWHVELRRENGEKFVGFFDVANGVYVARKRSGIAIRELTLTDLLNLQPNPPNYPDEVVFQAAFKATGSFILAVIRGVRDTRWTIEIRIEPNGVLIRVFDSQFQTTPNSFMFDVPEGFSANKVYDLKFVARYNPFEEIFIVLNGKTYTQKRFVVRNGLPGMPGFNSQGNSHGFGLIDDNVTLFLDYVRVAYRKGSVWTTAYDLSFRNVHGSVAESPNMSLLSTDINSTLNNMEAVIEKFYPSQAILESENKAAGLPANARGTVPSGGGWKRLSTSVSGQEVPFSDPFGECLVINRRVFEQ